MMKRLILIFSLFIITISLSAQTWMRYGMRVGRSAALVVTDSIRKVGNSLHFYDGATNMGTLWDGAGTALNAATGRTSLGATTVGAAFFMLTNPGAITFVRINADNSITALSAANFKTALLLTSSDVGLGNVTNESKATMFTNPTFTGHPIIEGVTLTGATGTGNLVFSISPTFTGTPIISTVLNPDADQGADLGASGTAFNKIYGDSLIATNLIISDSVALETIVSLQSDTVPLFVFGGGGANAGDTTAFTTSTIYGSYRTGPSDTTIITSINAVMVAGTTPSGTDTLAIQIYWNDSINVTGAGATLLNASALGINSVTTGTVDASFANNTIPPGMRVFCKTPGVVTGRKPIYFECTVYGYKQNRSY